MRLRLLLPITHPMIIIDLTSTEMETRNRMESQCNRRNNEMIKNMKSNCIWLGAGGGRDEMANDWLHGCECDKCELNGRTENGMHGICIVAILIFHHSLTEWRLRGDEIILFWNCLLGWKTDNSFHQFWRKGKFHLRNFCFVCKLNLLFRRLLSFISSICAICVPDKKKVRPWGRF